MKTIYYSVYYIPSSDGFNEEEKIMASSVFHCNTLIITMQVTLLILFYLTKHLDSEHRKSLCLRGRKNLNSPELDKNQYGETNFLIIFVCNEKRYKN